MPRGKSERRRDGRAGIRLLVVVGLGAAGRNVAVVAARPHRDRQATNTRIVWVDAQSFFCPSFGCCSLVVFLVPQQQDRRRESSNQPPHTSPGSRTDAGCTVHPDGRVRSVPCMHLHDAMTYKLMGLAVREHCFSRKWYLFFSKGYRQKNRGHVRRQQ